MKKFKKFYKYRKYSIDRIVINTEIPMSELKKLIDIETLKENCKEVYIGETSNSAKYWGYKSKIDVKEF